MGTVSTGETETIYLGAFQSLSLNNSGTGTVTFTSSAEKLFSGFVARVNSGIFGPFGFPVTVTIRMDSGSVTYDVITSASAIGGHLSEHADIGIVSHDTVPVAAFPFLSLRSDANYDLIPIPSPYSPTHVLHPSVVYAKNSFMGHRYWMAMTPYPDSDSTYENPCILASDNGREWSVPSGLTNPIYAKPSGASAYNSDTELYYDENNSQLVLLWRTIGEGGSANNVRLYIGTSVDGITWTARTLIYSGTLNTSDLASPSLWYNEDSAKWEIIGHNVGSTGHGVPSKITSSSLLTGWDTSLTALIATPPTGREWWHSQIKRLDDGTLVGIAQDNNGTQGASGNMYAIYSSDGTTFTYSPLDLFTGWYRPCFVIRDDVIRGEYAVEFFGSKLTTSGLYRKMMRFEKGADRSASSRAAFLAAAAIGNIPQILIADTFNRGDDATGLGTSTSGHAWTTISGPTNVLGISSNKCYNVTTGNCRSTRDVSTTDYLLRYTIDTKSAEMYAIVRYIDSSNYCRIGVTSSSTQLRFQRITSGSAVVDTQLGATPANGDEVIIRCTGGQITIWLNERLLSTINETQGLTSTTVGLQMSGTLGGRLDNFLVTSL